MYDKSSTLAKLYKCSGYVAFETLGPISSSGTALLNELGRRISARKKNVQDRTGKKRIGLR